jgi:phosphoribulokinase
MQSHRQFSNSKGTFEVWNLIRDLSDDLLYQGIGKVF